MTAPLAEQDERTATEAPPTCTILRVEEPHDPCGALATHIALGMCDHAHVRTNEVCEYHARLYDRISCIVCKPDHLCPITPLMVTRR